jgi:hypothetical protein
MKLYTILACLVCIINMVKTMLRAHDLWQGQSSEKSLQLTPLFNDSVSRQNADTAGNVSEQLVENISKKPFLIQISDMTVLSIPTL